MKIGYVVPRYVPHTGGLETHVRELARAMVCSGHEVDVLTEEGQTSVLEVQSVDGVTVRRFYHSHYVPVYPFAPSLWLYLARHAHVYDIIHAHNYHAFPALGAALTVRQRLVFTPHYHATGSSVVGSMLHVPYRLLGGLEFRRAARIICVSRTEEALVSKYFSSSAGKVIVIPNGVNTAAFQTAKRFPIDRRVVLAVGRLKSYKNVQHIVESMVHLDDTYELNIVGSGPALASLSKQSEALNLQHRVRYLGSVDDDDLRRWYRTARVYVTMSAQEAFGITVLEALAAGTPVIASNIDAHREVSEMVGGSQVTLLPVDVTPSVLARSIRSCAEEESHFVSPPVLPSWSDVAERTLEVYTQLLDSS